MRGRFTDHHALLIGLCLDHTSHIEAAIARLDERVDALFAAHTSEAGVPFVRARDRLDTITGVGKRAAETIIAEAGSRGALLRPRPPQNRACASSTHTAQASREGVAGAGFLRLRAWSSRRQEVCIKRVRFSSGVRCSS